METEKYNYQLDTSVASHTMLKISKTLKFIQFFYHSTLGVEDYTDKLLPTDEFPFIIEDKSLADQTDLKNAALLWLSQKALEDFILGINLGLVELTKMIRISNFCLSTYKEPAKSREAIEDKISSIEKKVQALSLPVMINEVEEWLGKELVFKKEILSINKARACFAHRNGIVNGVKDYNDKENKCLKISWVCLRTEICLENGEWVKMTFDLRESGFSPSSMRIMQEEAFLSFKDKEKIELDFNALNSIGITCVRFIQNLHMDAQEILKAMAA